jgi:NAD(P)-dependent dehydrogenase (short-subunit alcohol dehydrogenase family)
VKGEVMIITGASRGIGAATARLAGAAGFAVCVNHRDSAVEAERVAAEVTASGAKAIVVQADVGREADVVRLFEITDRELGSVTALINNAGFTGPAGRRIENVDAATLHSVFDTNVIGSMLCAREAIRRMSTRHGRRGGYIINLSSTATRMGSPNDWVDYAASKGAIDVFTQGLAREVAEDGIRVNAVAPGLIDTELHARAGEPDRPARYLGQIPMKRAGTAEEVAQTILWLLTQAPAYIAGAVVPISGGR